MKYLITIAAFTATLIIMLQFEFPLFWQVIAAVITSMGVFFGFTGDQSMTSHSDTDQSSNFATVNDINDYVPINEYNKKHGVATEVIKQKISDGELKGTRYNGIWYIHRDEIK